MATITLKDFQRFAQQRIGEGLSNPEQFHAKLKEVLDFAVANESAMDAEANAYVDKVMDGLAELMEHGLSKIADSPDKRRMSRLVALTRGKHSRAEKLLEGLGRPLPKQFVIVDAAKPIFLGIVQSILDVLFDATRESHEGPAKIGMISMLYWVIDELNVAFYLAEHKYATQVYSHLRTVYDLLEKVELFFKQPKWAEVWGGNDKKQIIRELSPGSVRAKLGKPKFDAVYSFLSELGSHGTFEAVRRRIVKRGNKNNRTQVAIWVGGVPWDSEVIVSVSFCIFAAISALIMAVGVFEDRLHEEEALEIMKARSDEAIEFLRRYFVELLRDSGIDVSEFMQTLSAKPSL